jgi:hypothetical protein
MKIKILIFTKINAKVMYGDLCNKKANGKGAVGICCAKQSFNVPAKDLNISRKWHF